MSDRRLLQSLGSYPDFERGSIPGSVPFRVDRTARALDNLGRPDGAYRIVHVAGTKGKGSTAAMVASILREAGFRTGLYTSPHLLDFTERVAIDGLPVAEEDLLSILEKRVKPAFAGLSPEFGSPTFFEVTTVMALEMFAQASVDVAVVEVGIGGALDATNAIGVPVVAVLTPISYDHTSVLGASIQEIAVDKSGIIKRGCEVVVGRQLPVAAEVIENRAGELGVCPRWVERAIAVRRLPLTSQGQILFLDSDAGRLQVRLPLSGRHQAENAATALLAVLTLMGPDALPEATLAGRLRRVTLEPAGAGGGPRGSLPEAMVRGLSGATVPGRFQQIVANPSVVVDVAHNHASALALAATVREVFDRPANYIVGMYRDKDHRAFASALDSDAEAIVCVDVDGPRGLSGPDLARAFSHAVSAPIVTVPSVATALEETVARNMSTTPIVVTGSFPVVAGALRWVASRVPATGPAMG